MEIVNEYREIKLENTPQYFGAYLNNARHNLYLIINHLAEKFGYTILLDDGAIAGSFLCNKITRKPNHIFSDLTRYLPIAKVFDPERLPKAYRKSDEDLLTLEKGIDFERMSNTLRNCFKELNQFRNNYTHCYSTISGFDRKLQVDDSVEMFIKDLFRVGIEYTKKRFEGVFKEEDFQHLEQYFLFKEDGKINQNGITFFTCLFLDRETAFQFLNRIKGYKATYEPKFRVTREVFCAFCIKLPHEKLVSDDPLQALAMDMLNELNKCPANLFEVLTDEDKQKFQPNLSEAAKDNLATNSKFANSDGEDFEEYLASITKRVRRSDRFPYFALRYLDEINAFQNIRFQINLGKFQIDEYSKIFDNLTIPRYVIENAHAFGKLLEFNDQARVTKDINKIKNQKSFFEQWAPHYNIKNNKIAILLSNTVNPRPLLPKLLSKSGQGKVMFNLFQNLPTAFISVHELPKIIMLEIKEPGKAESIIKKFIDDNSSKIFNNVFIKKIKSELLYDKSFNKGLQTKKSKAYNQVSLDMLKGRKNTLNTILLQHGLSIKQIPSRIVNYWLNISETEKSNVIAENIKEMKRDCVDRLKQLRKGKGPKIGEMATFLAKDIVQMVISEDVKQKITSFYYDMIQESLALYADPEKKMRLKNLLLSELDLFNPKTGHPFLNLINLDEIWTTRTFYEKYLMVKGKNEIEKYNSLKKKYSKVDISWINKTFYGLEWNEKIRKNFTTVKIPSELSEVPFSIRELNKGKSNFDEWLKNVTSKKNAKPIDLPTNLFDEAIKKAYFNGEEDRKYHYHFIDYHGKDNIQAFYNFTRHYKIYGQNVIFDIGTKTKFKDYFIEALNDAFTEQKAKRELQKKENRRLPGINKKDIQKVFYNVIETNEVKLRFQQEKDRLMIMMCQNLISGAQELQFDLRSVENILNDSINISQQLHGKIITATRKRKDFAIFKRLLSDRRIVNLLAYYELTDIDYQVIKNEINDYHKYKELIFDKIFDLERKIIETDVEGVRALFVEKNDNGNKYLEGNIQHFAYLDWLLDRGIINEFEYEFMSEVRNKFSHNQYPSISTTKFPKMKFNAGVSKSLFEKYLAVCESILDRIN